jgi:hypothetical protein
MTLMVAQSLELGTMLYEVEVIGLNSLPPLPPLVGQIIKIKNI